MNKYDINSLIFFAFKYTIVANDEEFKEFCEIIKRYDVSSFVKSQLRGECERRIKSKDLSIISDFNFNECEKLLKYLVGGNNG